MENYENMKFCQCCAMPMNAEGSEYGTNADGSKSEDYCSYCYDKGNFTAECTMEEMIEGCVAPMAEATGMEPQQARKQMEEFFPTLKRWKKTS